MEPMSRKLLAHLLLVAINLIALQVSIASTFFIDHKQSPQQHQWSYHEQPQWAHQHKQCSMNAQSPIDIQSKNVISNGHLKLQFFNYDQPTKFKLSNAHHTIKMNPIDSLADANSQFGVKLPPSGGGDQGEGEAKESSLTPVPDIITADEDEGYHSSGGGGRHSPESSSGSRLQFGQQVNHLYGNQIEQDNSSQQSAAANSQLPYNGAPTIKLDWLDDGNNEFRLQDVHFHWGERRDNGSEHAIDGSRAAMEMHLVHIKHGLDKSKIGFTSDSVTVIGILIESSRKGNTGFMPIVNALTQINATESSQELEYKSIQDLMPNRLNSFYTYSGSLTTPPCYQVVNWIVMTERLTMNAKQIEMFRNLYAPAAGGDHDSSEQLIMPNIRQLQPLNNRTILASFSTHGKLEQGNYNNAIGGSVNNVAHSAPNPYTGAAISINNRWSWAWCLASLALTLTSSLNGNLITFRR